ncbi:hypothetical protein [Nocardia carnea]|uniref:hypothetical protein n=1 Tax=Nocardia carnea TaxID=37328 RepID=UPI0024546A1F|nr:hypothetical protein [Nocardia carnea]
MTPQVIKVFTPVKRVPTMIGKAQNGQKLPFGPYTLPQVAGVALGLIVTSAGAMTLPANPAITFLAGLALTAVLGFGLGLVPYTGVRLFSRVLWFARLICYPKPVLASGMPVTPESARITMFVEETVVAILPHEPPPASARPSRGRRVSARGGQLLDLLDTNRTPRAMEVVDSPTPPPSRWRTMISSNGGRSTNGEGR